jgi:cytochrome c-type biogenesis protein CcmH
MRVQDGECSMKQAQKKKFVGQFYLAALLAVVAAFSIASLALAQGSGPGAVTDDQVNAVARQLYCPVCENIPLDVCGTQACAQWRELIREKLGQGWGERQIKGYFAAQYGDRVLAAPPARGLNWLVYIVPPLAILAGIFILYTAFRAWRKPATTATADQAAEPSPDAAGATQDEYVKRLEEELSKR